MFKIGDLVKYVRPNDQNGGLEVGVVYKVEELIVSEFGGEGFLKVFGNKYIYYTPRFDKATAFKGNKHATAS